MSNKLSEERKTCEKKLAEEKNKIETQYNQIMKDEMAKMKADLTMMITPFDSTAFRNSAILTTKA
jgi:flagellar capping protein FliD